MRIGITISFHQTSIFSSGINQNALYVAMMLDKAGHSVHLITYQSKAPMIDVLDAISDLPNVKAVDYKESFDKNYDVVLCLGYKVDESLAVRWRKQNKNIKLVTYQCGNDFMTDMEMSVHNTTPGRASHYDQTTQKDAQVDAVWTIPQHIQTNEHWMGYMKNTENVTVVPFVWDPILIEKYFKKYKGGIYSKEMKINKFAVMEPNLSVMKNFLIPLCILEKVNKDKKIENVYFLSTDIVKKYERTRQLLLSSSLKKEGKLSAESRHPTPKILTNYAHCIVSWQMLNALNYLYLDAAWMGYPVVHNAHLCPDVGYYYEGFNVEEGANRVKEVMTSHQENSEQYLKKNRETITRYTRNSEKLIQDYNMLLEDLVSGNFKKYDYSIKDNSIIQK